MAETVLDAETRVNRVKRHLINKCSKKGLKRKNSTKLKKILF